MWQSITTFLLNDGVIPQLKKLKRKKNERKFKNWEDLPDGGRRYWYEVHGRLGWKAKYIKEVDAKEETTRFYQEIYNQEGELIEIHEKYPEDKGHQKIH